MADLAAVQAGKGRRPASAPAPSPPAREPGPPRPPADVPPPSHARPTPARRPARRRARGRPRRRPRRCGAGGAEPADRVVRVTAESLTRLMGLAGESLVQTRRFRPFVDSLLLLKGRQTGLLETLQRLEDRLPTANGGAPGRRPRAAGQGQGSGRAMPGRLGRDARDDRGVRPRQRGPLGPAPPRGARQPDAAAGRRHPRLPSAGPRRLAAARQAGEVRGRRRDHGRRPRHPRRPRGPAQPPDPQRARPRARDRPTSAAPRASTRPARSGWRPATARGCSRSCSSDDGRGDRPGAAPHQGRREGADHRRDGRPAERGRAARLPLPARLLDQGEGDRDLRAGAWAWTSCRAWCRRCAGRSASPASSARGRGSSSSSRSPSRSSGPCWSRSPASRSPSPSTGSTGS